MTSNIYQKLVFLTVGAIALGTLTSKPTQASTLVGSSFQKFYSSQSLGLVPGVPFPSGGLAFFPDDPNTLYWKHRYSNLLPARQ